MGEYTFFFNNATKTWHFAVLILFLFGFAGLLVGLKLLNGVWTKLHFLRSKGVLEKIKMKLLLSDEDFTFLKENFHFDHQRLKVLRHNWNLLSDLFFQFYERNMEGDSDEIKIEKMFRIRRQMLARSPIAHHLLEPEHWLIGQQLIIYEQLDGKEQSLDVYLYKQSQGELICLCYEEPPWADGSRVCLIVEQNGSGAVFNSQQRTHKKHNQGFLLFLRRAIYDAQATNFGNWSPLQRSYHQVVPAFFLKNNKEKQKLEAVAKGEVLLERVSEEGCDILLRSPPFDFDFLLIKPFFGHDRSACELLLSPHHWLKLQAKNNIDWQTAPRSEKEQPKDQKSWLLKAKLHKQVTISKRNQLAAFVYRYHDRYYERLKNKDAFPEKTKLQDIEHLDDFKKT